MSRQEGSVVPDLVKSTELFLVPSSFLVAALGTADTNLHRAAVSLLGLIVSILWFWCTREALIETKVHEPAAVQTARLTILARFPLVFVAGWFASIVVHLFLASQPLGAT